MKRSSNSWQGPWSFGLLISFALLVGLAPPAWAGAWTVPRDRWYAEYFYRYFGAKKDFDSEGDSSRKANAGSFRDFRNEWKLEYGLTDRLNVLASIPLQASRFRDANGTSRTVGVGDMWLRSKFRALEEPLVTSVQVGIKIDEAYDRNDSPALGDGQVDVESRLLLSRAFPYAPYEVKVPKQPPPPTPSAREQSHEAAARSRRSRPPSDDRRHATERESDVVSFLYRLAQAFRRDGRLDDAAHELRKLLLLAPDHRKARKELAEIESLQGSARERAIQEAMARQGRRPVDRDEAIIEALSQTHAQAAGRLESPIEEVPVEPFETQIRYGGVAFFNVEGGFTVRDDDPANEFPLFLEAGFTPVKRVMLVGSLESVLSLKTTNEQEEEYSKWGLRVILNILGEGFANVFRTGWPTVNVELGYNDLFAGRNTADAFEVFGKVGIFF